MHYRGNLLLRLSMLLVVGPLWAAPPSPQQGKALFEEQCAACHTLGKGDLVGPDLAGVTQRRPRAWLLRFLLETEQVHEEGDSIALALQAKYGMPMPDPGLDRSQAEAVIAYLEQFSAPAPAQETPAPSPPPATGDPAVGQALFTGQRPFQNGGAPCISCHQVARLGGFGGGTLGPDLSQVYRRYGESGLRAALKTLPYPTMKPLYEKRPLTPEEQDHLVAFFQAVEQQPEGRTSGFPLWILGILGGGILVIVAGVLWRPRSAGAQAALRSTLKEPRRPSREKGGNHGLDS